MTGMSHERKKDGKRKDKKMAKMREGEEARHETAPEKQPTTDETDIITYKPGRTGDHNVDPQIRASRGKGPK